MSTEPLSVTCDRCQHSRAGGGDVAQLAGSPCPTGCGGTLRAPSCGYHDDEPVGIDRDGELTVSGYWR